jgi:hypothetical protein
MEQCPICRLIGDDRFHVRVTPRQVPGMDFSVLDVACPRCGECQISEVALDGLSADVAGRISGFVRHCKLVGAGRPFIWQKRPELTPERLRLEFFKNSIGIEEVLAQTPSTVAGKQDALLVALSILLRPGEFRDTTAVDASFAYSVTVEELSFFVNQLQEAGFLTPGAGNRARITTPGWARAEELKRGGVVSRRAFVAMWFADEMKPVYQEAIAPAIEAAGYEPRQVSFLEYNDDINDRILAEIRGARFTVADFTGNRPGVYLEAGFAMGLGRVVIWTVHEDHLKGVHFDARNRNHIVWSTPAELKERLHYRILATVPAL